MFRQCKDGIACKFYSVVTYLMSYVIVCCRLQIVIYLNKNLTFTSNEKTFKLPLPDYKKNKF